MNWVGLGYMDTHVRKDHGFWELRQGLKARIQGRVLQLPAINT